uniref:Lig_chan-Glu_bd domain-containing protein n=1 Tax=Macrostomum lignano TaxID=282301 RepID=A0A1I8IU14_9PLAT
SSPMTIFNRTFSNKTVILNGMAVDILRYLAEKLDFRFITKDSDDGNWGSPQADSEFYNGCVGELQRGMVHIGAGPFTKTAVRDRVIDYSTALFQESNGILVPKPERESRLWNLFMPFTYKVWLTIIGTIVGCSLIAWLFAFFSPFSAFNLGADYAVADEVWLKEYLWSCIGSFLQQGQDFYPFAMSARAVLASWWFFIVIIYAIYSGVLTSFLTVTVTKYPIKTLDDLVTQTAVTPYVRRGTNLFDLLSNAQSGVYKQLAEQVVLYDPDVESCPSNPPRADQACVEDYSALLAIALKNCTQYYVANEQFNTGTIAFMFPEDAPYANLFNFQ